MATTQNTFTGDGSTVLFSFTFPYIKEADVSVTLDGVSTTAYSFANPTTLEFNTAPANGAAIRIFRDTDIDTLSATFFPGSALKAEDLNDNFTQAYYAVQETDNDVATANTTAASAVTTAEGAVTTADAAAVDAAAAVTTANTANTNSAAAQTAATNAATSAADAATDAAAAQASAAAAATDAATAAADAATAVTDAATALTTANTANTTANAAANVADAFTATGTPATALTVDVPIDAANGVKLPTNSNSYDEEGAIRYNTTLDKIEIRKGSGWSTAAGGATVSSTPPTLATAGDVWYDHDNGRAYVFYNDGDSDQWVEMNPSWNGSVSDGSITPAKLSTGGPYWDTNGNVGVGTTSPSTSNLAIVNASNAVLTVGQNVDGTGLDHLGIAYSSGTGSIFTSNGDLNIVVDGGSGSGSSINLINGSGDRVVFDSNGRVGIGTSSPDQLLDIAASTDSTIQLKSTKTGAAVNDVLGTIAYYGSDGSGPGVGVKSSITSTVQGTGGAGSDLRFHTTNSAGSNNTEKVRIDEQGNVGIGTTSPVSKFQVNQSTDNEGITLSNFSRGSAYVQQRLAGSTNEGHNFAHYNGTNTVVLNGSSRTDHYWNTNGTERMRITNTGRVGIGTSSPARQLTLYASANPIIQLVNSTTDTTANDGTLLYGTGSDFVIENQETGNIRIFNGGAERLRVLSGGGLTFNGDTSTNNALDDYEEGSWTPTVDYGVISYQHARYTKIGRKVHLTGYIGSFSNRTQNSYIGVGGLPFSILTNSAVVGGSAMSRNANVITPVVYYSNARLYFYGNSSGDWIGLQHSHLNASTAALYFSVTYLTN